MPDGLTSLELQVYVGGLVLIVLSAAVAPVRGPVAACVGTALFTGGWIVCLAVLLAGLFG